MKFRNDHTALALCTHRLPRRERRDFVELPHDADPMAVVVTQVCLKRVPFVKTRALGLVYVGMTAAVAVPDVPVRASGSICVVSNRYSVRRTARLVTTRPILVATQVSLEVVLQHVRALESQRGLVALALVDGFVIVAMGGLWHVCSSNMALGFKVDHNVSIDVQGNVTRTSGDQN